MSDALMIIDMQNEYFEGGTLPLQGALEASLKAQAAATCFREQGRPIIHIRHLSARENATVFIPGTRGVQIQANVRPLADEVVIDKYFPNCFRQSTLLDTLKQGQTSRLVVCGMMTHMCVDTTVRAAFDLGFEVIVLSDATATKALSYNTVDVPAVQVQAAYLAALDGTFAKLMQVETYIENHG